MANAWDLSGYYIRSSTNWPEPVIEEFLNLVRAVQDLEEAFNAPRGQVGSAGVKQFGEGFASSTTGTGIYPIVFDLPQDRDYVILPTATIDGYIATYSAKTVDGFTIRITDSAGVLANSQFEFAIKLV